MQVVFKELLPHAPLISAQAPQAPGAHSVRLAGPLEAKIKMVRGARFCENLRLLQARDCGPPLMRRAKGHRPARRLRGYNANERSLPARRLRGKK